jgi:hypothetical protein
MILFLAFFLVVGLVFGSIHVKHNGFPRQRRWRR